MEEEGGGVNLSRHIHSAQYGMTFKQNMAVTLKRYKIDGKLHRKVLDIIQQALKFPALVPSSINLTYCGTRDEHIKFQLLLIYGLHVDLLQID